MEGVAYPPGEKHRNLKELKVGFKIEGINWTCYTISHATTLIEAIKRRDHSFSAIVYCLPYKSVSKLIS